MIWIYYTLFKMYRSLHFSLTSFSLKKKIRKTHNKNKNLKSFRKPKENWWRCHRPVCPILAQRTHFLAHTSVRFIRGGRRERAREGAAAGGGRRAVPGGRPSAVGRGVCSGTGPAAAVHPGRFSVLIPRTSLRRRWKTAFSLMRFAFHALIDRQLVVIFIFQYF